MKLLISLLILVLLPDLAWAQVPKPPAPKPAATTPTKPLPKSSLLVVDCTTTTGGSPPRLSSPFRVVFCVPNTDLDGGTVVALSNCRVMMDVTQAWSGVPTAIGPATATGLLPFETPASNPIPAARGPHTIQIACTPQDGQESDLSSPFDFVAVGGTGKPPTVMTVIK